MHLQNHKCAVEAISITTFNTAYKKSVTFNNRFVFPKVKYQYKNYKQPTPNTHTPPPNAHPPTHTHTHQNTHPILSQPTDISKLVLKLTVLSKMVDE